VTVAALDGEVVGFVIVAAWLPLPSAAHMAEFRGLAVAPEHQGEGIGSALFDHGIERMRAAGKRRLLLRVLASNPGAVRLYESRGFVVEGTYREAFLIDGAYVDDLVMGLDLTAGGED
jgi:ribosomal protein S18 acetylase RimI-like enzyme